MNNKELFLENVSRVNKGKKRSIGGILSLNPSLPGRALYAKQFEIVRFCLNAKVDEKSFFYEVAHTTLPASNEKLDIDAEIIKFALTFGNDDKAGISLEYEDIYYHIAPNTNTFCLLCFDALIQSQLNKEPPHIESFFIFVDGKISNNEVFFGTTSNSTVANIIYNLSMHYKEKE